MNLPSSATKAPQLTWGKLKAALTEAPRKSVPWMDKIENDIRLAVAIKNVRGDDITFLGKGNRLYRPILARHKLYEDGSRKFYVMFIETLDRRFAGQETTSKLLIALILAARWRFTYFEDWEETLSKKFGDNLTIEEFSDNCKQLHYNLEWIDHESMDFGLDRPTALQDAFGFDRKARLERFYSDWEKEKKELFKKFPFSSESIGQDRRKTVKDAVIKFLSAVRQDNADFLAMSIGAFSSTILKDLRSEGLVREPKEED
jgi:hypothetical protein